MFGKDGEFLWRLNSMLSDDYIALSLAKLNKKHPWSAWTIHRSNTMDMPYLLWLTHVDVCVWPVKCSGEIFKSHLNLGSFALSFWKDFLPLHAHSFTLFQRPKASMCYGVSRLCLAVFSCLVLHVHCWNLQYLWHCREHSCSKPCNLSQAPTDTDFLEYCYLGHVSFFFKEVISDHNHQILIILPLISMSCAMH
jgi:hypothetical protein